jgi:hypothetical protein
MGLPSLMRRCLSVVHLYENITIERRTHRNVRFMTLKLVLETMIPN